MNKLKYTAFALVFLAAFVSGLALDGEFNISIHLSMMMIFVAGLMFGMIAEREGKKDANKRRS